MDYVIMVLLSCGFDLKQSFEMRTAVDSMYINGFDLTEP